MSGWAATIAVGLMLALTSYWHIGGMGTGGRPFAIFLLLGVVAVFAMDAWDGHP